MPETYIPRIAVVTGATSGIGKAAALSLAASGIQVIGVGRSKEKLEALKAEMAAKSPGSEFTGLICDFESLKQVRELAVSIKGVLKEKSSGRLDCLLNVAGQFVSWHSTTEEGYETQFAVNHLAPFLLTNLLLDNLCGHPSRVITVSSESHYHAWIKWNDIMQNKFYNPLFAYMQSKLANVLFTYELNRRFGDECGLRAYAVSPGLVNTDIALKNSMGISRLVWLLRKGKGKSPEEGARTCIYLATEKDIPAPLEPYWEDCAPCRHSRRSKDPDYARRLWVLSEKLTGLNAGN